MQTTTDKPKLVPSVSGRKLKISEAIRLGSSLSEQCTGVLYRAGASCALGAALEAVFPGARSCVPEGGENDTPGYVAFRTYWGPEIAEYRAKWGDDLEQTIPELNDEGMTREAIADLLQQRGW